MQILPAAEAAANFFKVKSSAIKAHHKNMLCKYEAGHVFVSLPNICIGVTNMLNKVPKLETYLLEFVSCLCCSRNNENI